MAPRNFGWHLGISTRTSGSQAFATSWALAAANTNPQGIADPPPPSTATPEATFKPVVILTSKDDDVPIEARRLLVSEVVPAAADVEDVTAPCVVADST